MQMTQKISRLDKDDPKGSEENHRWKHRALVFLRWAAMGIGLCFVIATFLPWLSSNAWWLRYLDFPRIEYLIVLVFVGLLLIVLPWTRISILMLILVEAAAAYNAWVLLPYTKLVGTHVKYASVCPAGDRLRVLEANVQMTNRHDHRLRDLIRQLNPDIAWFQEVDEWWYHELSSLQDELPHAEYRVQPNYFGVYLLSRFPLVNPRVMSLTASHDPSVFTEITLRNGQNVRFYGIHPRPPLVGQSTAERNAQISGMALAAHDDGLPHLVAGDFNAVPWEGVVRRALRVGEFLDPRIGRGFRVTWNAKRLFLRWPLDQILTGKEFTLISLRVLPSFGSDHYPYFAELCFDPKAAQRQAPPPIQAGDIASARKAAREGQRAANKTGYQGRVKPSDQAH